MAESLAFAGMADGQWGHGLRMTHARDTACRAVCTRTPKGPVPEVTETGP